ncbi:MAG: SIS domain-containing protein, partial [Cyclobacteriaceae bacterium]|nr:SIS domain-containing protein [Cyclobacteriaceae bacterium]
FNYKLRMNKKILDIIDEHKKTIQFFEEHSIENVLEITKLIENTFDNGDRIYLCGNGGSMADCQHIAGEFVGKYRKVRQPLPAIALSTDPALTTCIANDFSYEDIFSRQIEALGKKGDVLWAFSTSGTSPNVIAAVKMAQQKGLKVIGFTGKSNSPLEKLSDVCLCANSNKTNHSQEVHELAYHIICDLIDENYD